MSTRAIIAVPRSNGGYVTAWNWNDGMPDSLGRELRTYFMDKTSIQELLDLHSFSCICGEKLKKELMDEFPENYQGEKASRFIKLSNNRYILMQPHQGVVVAGAEPDGYFKTIDEMLEQDLNYVYVFEDGKWKTYK